MQDYSHTASPSPSRTRRSLGLAYIIPIGLALGFVLFMVSFFLRNMNTPSAETDAKTAVIPTERPTPTVQETPTPTPMPENDTAIRILNGSGVAGAAGKVEDVLKELGYTNTRTGNAGGYTYKDITIQSPSGEKDEAETLKELLEKTYTVGEITTPASGSATEITVIVGK